MKTTLKILTLITIFFDDLYFMLGLLTIVALVVPMIVEYLGENTEFYDIVQHLIIK